MRAPKEYFEKALEAYQKARSYLIRRMSSYNKIWVEEYERNIPLYLVNNSVGTVHSVFNNGMNILMGERLFFIGTEKNGKLPFGIHL